MHNMEISENDKKCLIYLLESVASTDSYLYDAHRQIALVLKDYEISYEFVLEAIEYAESIRTNQANIQGFSQRWLIHAADMNEEIRIIASKALRNLATNYGRKEMTGIQKMFILTIDFSLYPSGRRINNDEARIFQNQAILYTQSEEYYRTLRQL